MVRDARDAQEPANGSKATHAAGAQVWATRKTDKQSGLHCLWQQARRKRYGNRCCMLLVGPARMLPRRPLQPAV